MASRSLKKAKTIFILYIVSNNIFLRETNSDLEGRGLLYVVDDDAFLRRNQIVSNNLVVHTIPCCWFSHTSMSCAACSMVSTSMKEAETIFIHVSNNIFIGETNSDLELQPFIWRNQLGYPVPPVLMSPSIRPSVSPEYGMVHAWAGQKLVKSNIFTSFIWCHKVAIESQFYISDT